MVLALMLFASPLQAAGLLSFTFEGTRFGSYLVDFQQRYPEARVVRADARTTTYAITPRSAAWASFEFYQNKLYRTCIIYRPATVVAMENVKRMFGPNYDVVADAAGTMFTWETPGRRARAMITEGNIVLFVWDTAIEAALNRRDY
jgi:hypothetical protein